MKTASLYLISLVLILISIILLVSSFSNVRIYAVWLTCLTSSGTIQLAVVYLKFRKVNWVELKGTTRWGIILLSIDLIILIGLSCLVNLLAPLYSYEEK